MSCDASMLRDACKNEHVDGMLKVIEQKVVCLYRQFLVGLSIDHSLQSKRISSAVFAAAIGTALKRA
eukprot:scaffold490631_cov20-Prasinocladus_malaysianus.AAC.1